MSYAKVYSIGALGAMLAGVAWVALAISDFAPAGVGFLESLTPPIRFVALVGTLGGVVLGLIWLALGYILWSERSEPALHYTRI